MIGKLYLLLPLLRAAVSGQWSVETPREVTAQTGTCVRIPCRYRYPPELVGKRRRGIWFYNTSVVYHSEKQSQTLPTFRHRTQLSGDLNSGDCSLLINHISPGDEGFYRFRVEFDKSEKYNYRPPTQLRVTDFTDRPSVFPAEVVAGEAVKITCAFNTTCNAELPTLTWVNPPTGPVSNTSSVTQHGETLTLTSVLSLTPTPEHHGQNLTCRVSYPAVWSERSLTLSVQYRTSSMWKEALIAVGVIFSITVAAIFTYTYIRLKKAKGASETRDPAVSYSTPSAIHKAQVREDTAPGIPVPGNEREGEPAGKEELLYAQLQELSCGDPTVPKTQGTEYASIRFL